MTKSTITRERAQQIFLGNGPEPSASEERELARMTLVAMDSEPVILYRQVNPVNGMKTYWAELDPEEFRHLKKYTDENAEFMTLYLHAQPAPAVPGKWIPVSEQKPDCWCLTCRPVVLNDMRFVVCPDCGNKRCPRANDHRNACTGSNEPGQEGGAYPDTPQEVKP